MMQNADVSEIPARFYNFARPVMPAAASTAREAFNSVHSDSDEMGFCTRGEHGKTLSPTLFLSGSPSL